VSHFDKLARIINRTAVEVFSSEVTFTPSGGPSVSFLGAYTAPGKNEQIYGAMGVEQPDHSLQVMSDDVPAGLVKGSNVTVNEMTLMVVDITPRAFGTTMLSLRPND
jgi:hypothetical protein